MAFLEGNPCFRPASILLAALSLSIGWGIRGNYGHEFGAMLPGALTAMAVCLISAREDWKERLAYFAFFGALGWGFGGSFSYMQVIGYTHSGHQPSQLYGFFALFVLGFLWAALGGAGTALPAAWDRRQLAAFFRPLLFVFAAEVFLYFTLDAFEARIQLIENAEHRHESSLYWLDSDWIPVLAALGSVLLYDLVNRRFEKAIHLLAYGFAGGIAGFLLQWLLDAVGLSALLAGLLVHYQGDTGQYPRDLLVTNWPILFTTFYSYLGVGLGLLAGIGVYFARYGEFRNGSKLILCMTLGWWIGFLLLPVLLDIRMTPPRSDSWAGGVGLFAGAAFFLWRTGLHAVLFASIVCGIIGGIGFSGASWLKLMMVSFGNSNLVSDPAAVEAWRHYQSANWHSFLEQTYGFVNGIGVIVAMGLLVMRLPRADDRAPRRRWTEAFAIFFALPVLTYINMVKNVDDWTQTNPQGYSSVPAMLKAPLLPWIEMSALAWFNVLAGAVLITALLLMVIHLYRPIPLLSLNGTGRGQLAYLILLWVFVLGNAAKALAGFHEARLLTEGVIILNALLVTILALAFAREDSVDLPVDAEDFRPWIKAAVGVGLVVFLLVPLAETASTRYVYGNAHAGHSAPNYRFGEKANWRTAPLLKGAQHR